MICSSIPSTPFAAPVSFGSAGFFSGSGTFMSSGAV